MLRSDSPLFPSTYHSILPPQEPCQSPCWVHRVTAERGQGLRGVTGTSRHAQGLILRHSAPAALQPLVEAQIHFCHPQGKRSECSPETRAPPCAPRAHSFSTNTESWAMLRGHVAGKVFSSTALPRDFVLGDLSLLCWHTSNDLLHQLET